MEIDSLGTSEKHILASMNIKQDDRNEVIINDEIERVEKEEQEEQERAAVDEFVQQRMLDQER